MPTIDIGGTGIFYERSGDGPSVLFVHGMCGDAESWADQVRRLSDRYDCVRYDRRGHTRSARGEAVITDGRHADDAAVLIEALGLAPCLVVGSSGGAKIALDLAMRHGRLLRGVVYSEPPLFSLAPDAGTDAMAQLAALAEQAASAGDPAVFVDGFFPVICPGLWHAIDDDFKNRLRANGEIGMADLKSPELEVTADDLAGVDVPALVIAGTTSDPALRSVAHRLAAALPDARLVELADCGHVTYFEQPDEFERAVATFAAEIERRSRASVDGQAGGAAQEEFAGRRP